MKYLAYIFLFLLSACAVEDTVLPQPKAEHLTVYQNAETKPNCILSLEPEEIKQDSGYLPWHLKFETTKDHWHIFLNPLESVTVFNTSSTDFNAIDSNYNLVGLTWSVDRPTDRGLQPAIGKWGDFSFSNPASFKDVYIVRVRDYLTARFYKLQILDATNYAYRIRYGSLNGSFDNTLLVTKDSEYAHRYLFLDTTAQFPLVEPRKQDWDISFTYVADSISNNKNIPFLPSINPKFGIYPRILLNEANVSVAIDTSHSFNELDYFIAKDINYTATSQINNPFLKWSIEYQQAQHQANTNLILRKEGIYYVLRVVNFTGSYPDNLKLDLELRRL